MPFSNGLVALGFDILSTGGTARQLREQDIPVTEISEFTNSPEMLGGRVKTLHPRVFGGILARHDFDEDEMARHQLEDISLVVVNLYEFEKTIADAKTTMAEAVEAIDIGGVSLIRAAAKNHSHCLVVVDPEDYDQVLEKLQNGHIGEDDRKSLAAKAFRHTASYDAVIANYLTPSRTFPEKLTLTYQRKEIMRYGENPHQHAALYEIPNSTTKLSQVQGKQLSYNNIVDTDTAVQCVIDCEGPACAIVKHANPCGLALGDTLIEAYEKAFRTDPTSAFGGIIAFNQPLDPKTLAHILDKQFVEVIVVPELHDETSSLASKRKNLRLLTVGNLVNYKPTSQAQTITNGLLVQDADNATSEAASWQVVGERGPTGAELDDLKFAWHVVKHVKSNAIVFARDMATTGVGAGQMNRVLSVQIAASRMKDEGLDREPSVMASDAFFPFRDGIDEAAKAGITAVVQPGGSIRDDEVIQACNEHNMAMVLTGQRHFKH